jgi:hypothetical protein
MKKLMMTLAAGLFATAVVAEVTSGNVVGYNTVELKVGVNAIAPSFLKVGGGGIDLQDLIPGTTAGLRKGTGAGTADNILIWDLANTKYNLYFLHDGTGKNNGPKASKWVNNSTQAVASNVAVTAQSGLFYVNNGAAPVSVQIAGQVVAAQPANQPIPVGVNMIAPPYTADWYLNNDGPGNLVIVNWATSSARKGTGAGTADNILIWDLANTKYNLYFLHDGTGKNNGPKANKWVNNATQAVETNLVVKANQGLFYVNNGVAELTLNTVNPYTLN